MPLRIDPKIEQIRINAKNAVHILNKKDLPDQHDIADYALHLRDMIKNPTRAMLALKEQNRQIMFNAVYERNKDYLKHEVGKTKVLYETCQTTMKNYYPKTSTAREYIICDGRLSLDKVTRSKGYSWADRLAIWFSKRL